MNYDIEIIKSDLRVLLQKINPSKFENSHVLITGANGLIGSFLADFFAFLNDKFNCAIKIALTSYSMADRAERIQHLLIRKDVEYFSWDCSVANSCYFPPNLDYVFFCSGYGQPSKFLADPSKTALINVVGIQSILDHLLKHSPFASLLFLSSSEIYGDPEILPTPETYYGRYSVENNRASYIGSKRLGEIICLDYGRKINTKIARVALAYGPGVLKSDGRVLQNFIFKASNDKKIQMMDGGEALRNYLYITDAVEILINILLEGKEKIYNVGGDTEPVSIYELASKVGSIFNVPVIRGQSGSDVIKSAPQNVGVSMERYRKEFNLKDIIPLDEGILRTIKWLKLI